MAATKLQKFEYMVHQFIKWYNELNKTVITQYPYENDNFSKLKLIKLHFFACAVTANPDNGEGLLSTFGDFHAMPYGHVESYVYSHLSNTESLEINNSNIKLLQQCPEYLSAKEKEEIDDAVSSLREKNSDLVRYSASKLVDLSHEWDSWQTSFSIAQKFGKSSIKIPNDLIINEAKFYHY